MAVFCHSANFPIFLWKNKKNRDLAKQAAENPEMDIMGDAKASATIPKTGLLSQKRDMPGTVIALLLIVICAWALGQTPAMTPMGSVFPTTIASVLLVFAILFVGINILRKSGPKTSDPASNTESTPRRIGLVVAMGIWIAAIPLIGFLAAGLLAFFALIAISNYDGLPARSIILHLLSGGIIVSAMYFLMAEILLIRMPQGILF